MTILFSVGVDEFRFILKTACLHKREEPVNICLSLRLDGDLMAAALSDRLSDTIDYEGLCQNIENCVTMLDCDSHAFMVERIRRAIVNFSPLIFGGCFTLMVNCHDIFIANLTLAPKMEQ
ncbi:MAG TPA: hypothetical protein VEL47_01615 [Myxococcota bacterium]|nr:hypothetical protein [Myxococcota bacterium]